MIGEVRVDIRRRGELLAMVVRQTGKGRDMVDALFYR
jgi:hypothetical protein